VPLATIFPIAPSMLVSILHIVTELLPRRLCALASMIIRAQRSEGASSCTKKNQLPVCIHSNLINLVVYAL